MAASGCAGAFTEEFTHMDVVLETWKDIPGYEDCYQVSDQGRVRSLDRVIHTPAREYLRRKALSRVKDVRVRGTAHSRVRLGRVMRPGTNGRYLNVGLTDGLGRTRYQLVHRLVLRAFVGPCPDGQEVMHLNHDRRDNRLSNLRYGTHSENLLMDVARGVTRRPKRRTESAAADTGAAAAQ